MSVPPLSSETLHASCVAIGGRAVLLHGRSGSGKSDLALRLIDRGAKLVSDDYTVVRRAGDGLVASAPPNISGRIEVRGIGIVPMEAIENAPVALMALLDELVERMPDDQPATRPVAGLRVPVIALAALEASAPIKLELALARFGLPARS
ncbi:HPr kinase/phosphorylase [Edaphosphingomonas haloaromaticamans]|uniref:HPr kinase/phosphorylase n=1 Tax=Edaphosphingomonas haloaromaticamans TaxID=653954 RepID=A0A1S1HFG4_9SPHN|nr:HPr kinase/phosphatase C-terminal domain-containing protein [Sphingomonas haloaromaticamans]OHT20788.1 HPr kinase/phosphorylase [Sphingomonas haloaromaticamans]